MRRGGSLTVPTVSGNSPFINKQNPGPTAGIAAIFCALAALFQLYLGLQSGGVPPEFVLFGVLALIFAGLWWASRRLN